MVKLLNLRKEFGRFNRDYSLAPMWFLNDALHNAEITRQLRELKAKNVTQVTLAPLAGLEQEYLSASYFECVHHICREARRLGMQVWIYDDFNWPGGCAGGQLMEQYPHYRMQVCRLYRYPITAKDKRIFKRILPRGRVIWAAAVGADGQLISLINAVGDSTLYWHAPRGKWTICLAVVSWMDRVLDAATGARWAHNIPGYIDVMNPDAVAKFIALVYEAHYTALRDYFGTTIKGFYCDEPGMWYDFSIKGSCGRHYPYNRERTYDFPPAWAWEHPDDPDLYGFYGSIPWTHNLLQLFYMRYGYDLRAHFQNLRPGGDRRVCYHYFQLISTRFAESFFGQIGAWCAAHGVACTGHIGEAVTAGDFYHTLAAMQIPGMDNLGGHMGLLGEEATLPKKVSSIMRMCGAKRSSCEVFGVTPWHYPLAGKIANVRLLALQGINMIVPIDFAYSMRGTRKQTVNAPGFFQAPAWCYQRIFSEHVARLCQIVSAGTPSVSVGILCSTGAELSNAIFDVKQSRKNEAAIREIYWYLHAAQIESDLIYEAGLNKGQVSSGALRFEGVAYRTIIIPPCDIIAEETLLLLQRFLYAGGRLVFTGPAPQLDPVGQTLIPQWQKLFGAAVPLTPITMLQRFAIEAGEVVWIPLPLHELRTSVPFRFGAPVNLFDESGKLVVLTDEYPCWLEFDLGAQQEVVELRVDMEPIKAEIAYDYVVEISNDRAHWRCVAERHRASGLTHVIALSAAHGQYLRWRILRGRRFLGMTALTIVCRKSDGTTMRWRPTLPDTTLWRNVLPDASAPLLFQVDGKPAEMLYSTVRRFPDGVVQVVMNVSDQEHHLIASLGKTANLEYWDIETGRCRVITDRIFQVTFAPWQTHVFTIGRPSPKKLPVVRLDLRRKTILELKSPWRFKPESPNAFPLAAGQLTMAMLMRHRHGGR